MKAPSSNGVSPNPLEGERRNINSELWHACAGPLISLPPAGSLVVYFPQGHSEQVAASMQKQTDFIPSYPNLPSKLICMLQNVTLNADPETEEVYAQMSLQPVNKYDRDALLASDMGLKINRQPNEFFCKTLTASDTSTHGGFSVPRRAAEKIFPALDFSMQPPCQELVAKDIHDNTWTFRHIFRGQPKRHLLTTGWSVFVSTKRLFAGDSVLFVRDGKGHLLLGIRRANRQQPALSSSVISSDSMHIGVLAAAAHANANNSPFTIFYNPRAAPAEFVVPLAKYTKAMYAQVSLGMRFRMIFETEECGVRRYMGTVTGISDLDPVRWKNSQWRNLQIGWDESAAGDRPSRVSVWDIEPVLTPFYICPPPFFRPRFAGQPGMPDDGTDMESALKRAMPWLDNGLQMKDPSSTIFPGLSLVQWMSMQQQNGGQVPSSAGFFPSMVSPTAAMHNSLGGADDPSNFQQQQQSTQLQHTHRHIGASTSQSIVIETSKSSSNLMSIPPQDTQFSRQMEQQQPPGLVQGHNQPQQKTQQSQVQQIFPQSLLEQPHLQFQLLQRLQQQQQKQQQFLSPGSSSLPSQLLHQQLQSQQFPQLPSPSQVQQFPSSCTNTGLPTLQPPQMLVSRPQDKQNPPVGGGAKAYSGITDGGDAPSSSTSPSTNNCQISSSTFLNRSQSGPAILIPDPAVDVSGSLVQDLYSKSDMRLKHELGSQQKPKASLTDHQLEASASGTSYGLDGGENNRQQNFLSPNFGLDGDSRNSLFGGGANVENGFVPETLLSRGYDSQKDLQNMLSNYGGVTNDIGTEMSTSAVRTQSFGIPNVPAISNDLAVNDAGVLGGGLWPTQTQRMRTYTKVQKRGSVGRSIDVNRYRGYDELRHDLARMFGIEGQLEDPLTSDWKLVYVDHENDILLVGDDPWEEFVNCVQSIKILSSAEVPQLSLDGNFAGLPATNQACSGGDNGNGWRGQYDDNSATSFNR
ncbi:hypothetical protein HID58_088584 [Brassica napus]|uniref:Auxin response factor n=1 Tax=Brassica napus TaxID=3708 RepID=A0ABQ7XZ48_BRANA|nr:hypothetical protein HID58_088584 [Brassica napus]